METKQKVQVSSEIGRLRRLLVHSPDVGIGKVIPSKMHNWLYDDIVDLHKMRLEYNEYIQVLLWLLDPEKIEGKKINAAFFKPSKSTYFNSDKVVEIEHLLLKVLTKSEEIKNQLVTHVCAAEKCSFATMQKLMKLPLEKLARVLISGVIPDEDIFVFPPVPNLIFTRDIAITINDHLLLTKPAERAREREAILTKYMAFYALFDKVDGDFSDKIIELQEDKSFWLDDPDQKATVEGGDVMMISHDHLVIGCSVRSSPEGVRKVIKQLFEKNVVSKVSVVTIPAKRDYMHIDTVFTQVKRNMWVVFGQFLENKENGSEIDIVKTLKSSKKQKRDTIKVTQFVRKNTAKGYKLKIDGSLSSLKALLTQISVEDFGCKKEEVDIILCAGGKTPYDEREQWTDACNLLVLREGVVIGYDRNKKTEEEFAKRGFQVIHALDFIDLMNLGKSVDEVLHKDTLIVFSSSELSRARGGSHCMSMPLWREEVEI
ncbi:MAG: arginine deiminase family protein [Chitinophagales bacterium]